ncbi:MAG TPA: MltA domain-containing protein [Burkholderiales bacterium]|nr:MltA domain-containing protein [Burkholderiales bacterium]
MKGAVILRSIMTDRTFDCHAGVTRVVLCAALIVGGCAAPKVEPPAKPAPAAEVTKPPAPAPAKPPTAAVPAKPPAAPAPTAIYRAVSWAELPGWRADNVADAWPAFLASCTVLAGREHWRDVCTSASHIATAGGERARAFFEQRFTPYEISSSESGEEGLITGYYEPLLHGSRTPTARFRFPVYAVPDDLLVIDMAELYPQLKGMRLRGRIDGRKVVPYYDRAAIENGHAPLRGKELVWVDDALDLFFLQIQGSGRVRLANGETIRVGYADQNGHPYRSIGRLLVERGELTLEEASMQGIKAWVRKNPAGAAALLNANPSYVFFRELQGAAGGPIGALGVPLTPERSIAVDRAHVPLGAPVFVSTTWPNSAKPLYRLMVAQDTGGAIRGPVRADFFWGFGAAAGEQAGRMKQRLRAWVLLPRDHPVPGDAG